MPSNPTITITIEGDHPHLAELLAAISSITSRPTATPQPIEPTTEPPTLALFDTDDLDDGRQRAYLGRRLRQYPRPYAPTNLRVIGWSTMRHHELEAAAKARRTTTDLVLFVVDNLARLTGTTGRFTWTNPQLAEILGLEAQLTTNAISVLNRLGAIDKLGNGARRLNLEVAK